MQEKVIHVLFRENQENNRNNYDFFKQRGLRKKQIQSS